MWNCASSRRPNLRSSRLFERWLYILKFADLYNDKEVPLPENLSQEEGITMALESMRRAYATDRVRALIEAREKAERDDLSRMQHSEATGKAKVGRAMLAKGLALTEVLELTGLSEAELTKLGGSDGAPQ